MNIALISPGSSQYSETFIQAHKLGFEGNVHFLTNGKIPTQSDLKGNIRLTGWSRIKNSILSRLQQDSLRGDKKAFENYLSENKIGVVYAEYGPTAVAVMDSCVAVNIPLVVNFHGYDAFVYSVLEEQKHKYEKLFQIAESIVVVSLEMKKQLISLGAKESKIVYTPCAPNDEFLTLDKSESDEDFLLFVGRFVEKKAPLTVLEVFSRVHNKDLKLVMIGEGPLLEESKKRAIELGVSERVEFLGVCNRDRVKEMQTKCFAFIQHSIVSSIGDHEGTPVGLLEAMATGTVVIGTNHGGIQDVIENKISGLLSDEGDVEGMAENVNLLFKQKELKAQISKNAKQAVLDKYSMKHHLHVLNSTLKNVVAGESLSERKR